MEGSGEEAKHQKAEEPPSSVAEEDAKPKDASPVEETLCDEEQLADDTNTDGQAVEGVQADEEGERPVDSDAAQDTPAEVVEPSEQSKPPEDGAQPTPDEGREKPADSDATPDEKPAGESQPSTEEARPTEDVSQTNSDGQPDDGEKLAGSDPKPEDEKPAAEEQAESEEPSESKPAEEATPKEAPSEAKSSEKENSSKPEKKEKPVAEAKEEEQPFEESTASQRQRSRETERETKRNKTRAKYDAAISHAAMRETTHHEARGSVTVQDRATTLSALETRARKAIVSDMDVNFQHVCRDFKISKEVVDRIEADVRAAEEDEAQGNRHSDALDAYTQHLRKKPDDAEIMEIQRDRRTRVADLLEQNRKSEELKRELDERRAYTKQIAQEVSKQEVERCKAIHESSLQRQQVIAQGVDKAVQEQRKHTEGDKQQRLGKVSEQLEHVRTKGNFPHKLALAKEAKARTSELKATSDHLRRGFMRKGTRPEVENDSKNRIDNADALAEARHKGVMKKMMKSERNTLRALKKQLKKKEADRATTEKLIQDARARRQEARERQEIAHEERLLELEEYDDANHELKARMEAEGMARRAAEKREAEARYAGLQERVAAVKNAPDPRKQHMSLFEEEIERTRKAHKERVAREAEIEGKKRERKQEAFLKRHEAEAAEQQELLILRETHEAQRSRMWRDRYQAKLERAEVAKLQNIVRNKNMVMASKADSLMAQEAIEMNRANTLVQKRTMVEKQLQDSSKNVDLKRKMMQGIYGRSFRDSPSGPLTPIDRSHEDGRRQAFPAQEDAEERELTALEFIRESSGTSVPFITLFVDVQTERLRPRRDGSSKREPAGEDQEQPREEDLSATAISLIRSEAESPCLELMDSVTQEEHRRTPSPQSRGNSPSSPIREKRASTVPLEEPADRSMKVFDTEARKRVRQEYQDKRKKPQFKPSRVLELPKPGGFAKPSLAYPTHNLLANSKISDDLRGVVERLMVVQHEVDSAARARWRENAGIQHTPERLEPLLVSEPSERLTKRTIAYEANLVKTAKDSTIPTIHDGVEPVTTVSKRLYDPDPPKPKPKPKPKKTGPKVHFTEEYFVKKFFDDAQVAVQRSRDKSLRAALRREDPRMETKKLDQAGEDELAHRLMSPTRRVRHHKPKPKSRPVSSLSNAAAVDRFYNTRLKEETALSQQLDKEYMKPLAKAKKLKPDAVKASADRLSQPTRAQ